MESHSRNDNENQDFASVVISNPQGPVHLGNGSIIQNSQVTETGSRIIKGDGVTVIEGDFHGNTGQDF